MSGCGECGLGVIICDHSLQDDGLGQVSWCVQHELSPQPGAVMGLWKSHTKWLP